jgi:FkbM family methyltransferase
MARNIFSAARLASGMVSAPWFYLAGRALKSEALLKRSIQADPFFFRALLTQVATRPVASLLIEQFSVAAQLAAAVTQQGGLHLKEWFASCEAQLLQDIFCSLVTEGKTCGYFVEVGVGNGRTISNTYMLEQRFGWNGILVEPNRSSHESIRRCRKAVLETRAASSVSGQQVTFQEIVGHGEHSRVASTRGHNLKSASVREYQVETASLTNVLQSHGAPRQIDYLSLDTEGSEVDILNGLDLDTYAFSVLTIEHNHNEGTIAALKRRLEPYGYRMVLTDISQFDTWFVHQSCECRLLNSNTVMG